MSNNIKGLLTWSLFLISLSTLGQEKNEVYRSGEADCMEALIIKSEDFWYENTDSAIFYAQQAIDHLNQFNDSILLGWAEISLSTGYYYKGVLDSALIHANLGLSIYKKVGDVYDISDAHNNLANILGDMGMIEPAITHYYEGLRKYEEWEYADEYSHYFYNNLATI